MGTSTIDGTLEAVWLKRRRAKLAIYDKLEFRLADGSTRTIGKSVVAAPVAERLVPGTSGRFYLYTSIDHKGLHGIRDDQGGAVFGFATANETVMLVVVLVNAVWLALSVALRDAVPILALALTVLGVPGFFLYRKTRLEARAQFEADSGYAPPAAAARQPVPGT